MPFAHLAIQVTQDFETRQSPPNQSLSTGTVLQLPKTYVASKLLAITKWLGSLTTSLLNLYWVETRDIPPLSVPPHLYLHSYTGIITLSYRRRQRFPGRLDSVRVQHARRLTPALDAVAEPKCASRLFLALLASNNDSLASIRASM